MDIAVVFVLIGTTHSGNLGAAARAMRTMGYDELRLVDTCSPCTQEALARSSGAHDVLSSAMRVGTLAEAVHDCHAIYGASARARQLAVPMLSCREAGEELVAIDRDAPGRLERVAFVFGRERSGLTNDELDLCTRHLHIPSDPDFSSLNLGAAVQVVAYEIAQAFDRFGSASATRSVVRREPRPDEHGQIPALRSRGQAGEAERLADGAAMEHFFAHLDRVMIDSGFLNPERPRHLRRRVRRYFERTRPTENELAILRGVLAAVEAPGVPATSNLPLESPDLGQ